MPGHPHVQISLNGREAYVDESMADFILACWRAGVSTHMSCQEAGPPASPGMAMLVFESQQDAERFLDIVAPDGEIDGFHPRLWGRWWVSMADGRKPWKVRLATWFKSKLLPTMIERLNEHRMLEEAARKIAGVLGEGGETASGAADA